MGLAGGDVRGARRFAQWTLRSGLSLDVAHCVVAELDGAVVGVMEAGADVPERSFGVGTIARGLVAAVRILGPVGAARMLLRLPVAARVQFDRVRDSYYVSELDVDPRRRNQGIGGELLRYAEERARAEGVRKLSLSTTMTNPARRLYERCGYRVIRTKADARYERLTGIPGRVLMVKDLS